MKLPSTFNPQLSTAASNEPAAIYRRVSTDQQENSMVVQEAGNDEYCRRLAFSFSDTESFADSDVSGGIPFLERQGGKLLMHRLKRGDIKHFIASKQDRVGRDQVDIVQTIRTIWEMGILPHFSAEGGAFPRTPDNEMLLGIKASVSEYEKNIIKQRTIAILNHHFNHYELTGNVPYGWDCEYMFADGFKYLSSVALRWSAAKVRGPDKTYIMAPADPIAVELMAAHGNLVSKHLVDNPVEQDIIRFMAGAVANKCKREHIANDLNKRGHKTKQGRPWQIGHVTSVLNNRYSRRLLLGAPASGPASHSLSALPCNGERAGVRCS